MTLRARLAALRRGVLMGPASAGLIPTNPGPRFPQRHSRRRALSKLLAPRP